MFGRVRRAVAAFVALGALVACGAERTAPVATPPPPPTTTTVKPPERPVVTRRERTERPPRTTLATTTTTTAPPPAAWAVFDEALSSRLIGSGDFAAAVAVAIDGRIVHTSEFGYRVPPPFPPPAPDSTMPADSTTTTTVLPAPEPEPIEPGDRFRIASISKVITAIVVLQLVEAGQLGLDEPVGERLGSHVGSTVTDPAVAGVTVRQLLAHTAGFPGYDNTFFGGGADSCTTAAQRGLSGGLGSVPGTAYRYSNLNYCLLGLLVEQVAGRAYQDVVTDRLLQPLGIQGMRLARTFDDDPSQVVHPSAPLRNYMEVLGAAGSWVATPSDVVKIMASLDPAMRGWHPLSPPMLELMRQPQANLPYPTAGRWYGLGLMSFGDGSFGHTGTLENTHAIVVGRPDGVVWAVFVSGEYPWETNDLRPAFERSLADAGIVLG